MFLKIRLHLYFVEHKALGADLVMLCLEIDLHWRATNFFLTRMMNLGLLFEIAIEHIVLRKLAGCYHFLLICLGHCEFLQIVLILGSLLKQLVGVALIMLVENQRNIRVEVTLVTISCCYRHFSWIQRVVQLISVINVI